MIILFPEIPCPRQSERCGDSRAGMSGFKAVILAFFPFREPGYSSVFPQGSELFISSGNQLVNIALVAHIIDNFIPGGIIYPVQRNGQFHDTEVGSKVASVLGNGTDQFTPDFSAQCGKLIFIQFFQICRGLDFLKHHLSLPNSS